MKPNKEQYFYSDHNATNGLLLLSIYHLMSTVMLKMAIFKYKAIALKLYPYRYCMCICFYFLTLKNYLIKKKKVSHTPCKSAVLRLGELRGILHTHTHTHTPDALRSIQVAV